MVYSILDYCSINDIYIFIYNIYWLFMIWYQVDWLKGPQPTILQTGEINSQLKEPCVLCVICVIFVIAAIFVISVTFFNFTMEASDEQTDVWFFYSALYSANNYDNK